MKKLMSIVTMLLLVTSMAFAQTKPAQKSKKAATESVSKTKKDGTPDMRYKANKEKAKPAGPAKKDGTPDMRYKANKAKKP